MDSLDGLPVFAKVVETGSFTGAAEAMGLSKSAVSKQVSKLEARLGAQLLHRTTRRISLTEVGQAFFERCERILSEIEEAELAVSRLQDEPRGTLRLNAPTPFGIQYLSPLIAEYMARYPEVSVDVTLNDRFVDLVEEGYDLAVRITKLKDSSLIARRLAGFRILTCASPEYWNRHGRPTAPQDLAEHEALIYHYLPSPEDWRFEGPDGTITVPMRARLKSNNGDVLRAAAVAGCGVIRSPAFIVGEDVKAGRLETVLGDWSATDAAIYAVWPPNRHLSAKVRTFVDFLAERFRGGVPWDCC